MKIKRLVLSLIFGLALTAEARAGLNEWTGVSGPSGATVNAFAYDPAFQTLYAGTGSELYRTANPFAASPVWTAVGNGRLSNGPVNVLAISGDTLFIGTNAGVFSGSISTSDWRPFNFGFSSNVPVTSLLIIGNTLYAGTNAGVYRTDITAPNWQAVNAQLPANTSVFALAASGNTLYAGTSSGVYRANAASPSWTAVNTGFPSRLPQILTLVIANNMLYAGTVNGLYRADAANPNWTATNSGLGSNMIVMRLAVDRANGVYAALGRLSATSPASVYRLDAATFTWSAVSSGLPANSFAQTLLIEQDTLFVGLLGAGTYRTSANPLNWTDVGQGFNDLFVTKLARDGDSLYQWVGGRGLYRRAGASGAWSRIDTSAITGDYPSVLAVHDALIYVGGDFGLYRGSTGTAPNWTRLNSGLPANAQVRGLGFSADTIYLSTEEGGTGNLYRAPKSNPVWSASASGLGPQTVTDLWVHDGFVYAGSLTGNSVSNQAYEAVLRADTATMAWQPFGTGMTSDRVNRLTLSGSTFYAATNAGIFSREAGDPDWTFIPGFPQNVTTLSLEAHDQMIYAGTTAGLYRIDPAAASITPVNQGFPSGASTPVWSLASDGTSLYAGTAAQGLFEARFTDCGDARLDAAEQCDDGNRDDGDGCNSRCQAEQAAGASNSGGSGNNAAPAPGGSGPIVIGGSLEGPGCSLHAERTLVGAWSLWFTLFLTVLFTAAWRLNMSKKMNKKLMLILCIAGFLPGSAMAAQERNLTPQADTSRSLAAHWHRSVLEAVEVPAPFPQRPTIQMNFRPAENKLIYVRNDREGTRCDQVFLFDADENREVRLTDDCADADGDGFMEGHKLDPSWGNFLSRVQVSADPDDPTLSGWTIVYLKADNALNDSVANGDCGNSGCQVWMKVIGPSLRASDVANYAANSPEIQLTNPRTINSNSQEYTYDSSPEMRAHFTSNGRNEQTVVFVRHNDPASNFRDMLYTVSFNPNQLFSAAPGTPQAGQPMPWSTELNLTYRHSGNCPGRPAYDFASPQWFFDGMNVVFSVVDGTGFSQIGTVSAQENRTPGPLAGNVPNLAFSCGADAGSSTTADTTSLRIHTSGAAHHELPMPSLPLTNIAAGTNIEYGIVYQLRDRNDRYSLGGFSALREGLGTTGNSLASQLTAGGVAQIITWHAEENLDFQDNVGRRRPVWSTNINERRAWIGYERQDGDGTWQIYGTQLLLEPAPAPTRAPRVGGGGQNTTIGDPQIGIRLVPRLGTLQIGSQGQDNALESRWTNCPGDHHWPEFQPALTITTGTAMGLTLPGAPTNIAYGKALGNPVTDRQITLLSDLPNPLQVAQCQAIDVPPVEDDVSPTECTANGGRIERIDPITIADYRKSQYGPINLTLNGQPIVLEDGQPLVLENGTYIGRCVIVRAGVKMAGNSIFGAFSLAELLLLGVPGAWIGLRRVRRK